MESIIIDGMGEHDFRHSIEDLLRLDEVDEAVTRLRALLEPYAGGGMFLPARFLDVTADDVKIAGLDKLAARLEHHDRPGFPITGLGVVLADARVLGGPGPKSGRLAPFIKTYYFSDDAYPFTDASRDDLLDGYSREGFGWQADYQATDATIKVKGIDDLHGALIELEDRLLDRAEPPEEAVRAGSIGACYLAVLIHQALRETIDREGLPRPLCVLAACDGVYPFFDAPVAGWDDCHGQGADEVWPSVLADVEEMDEDAVPVGRQGEGSLLGIVARKGTKQLALAMGEEDAREAARFNEEASAQRLIIEDAKLKGLFQNVPMADLGLADLFEEGPGLPGHAGDALGADAAALWLDGPIEPQHTGPEEWEPEGREAEEIGAVVHEHLTGHSLRERFRADADAHVPAAGPFQRLVDWLKGFFGRHR